MSFILIDWLTERINTFFLSKDMLNLSKAAVKTFLKDHVTLKTEVMAAEKSTLPSQE